MHHLRSVSRHAVNWRHPGNRDLRLWLYGLPGRCGGGQWRDLTGRHTGTPTNGPTWVPTGRGDLGIACQRSGVQYVGVSGGRLAGLDRYTLAVWVRVAAAPSGQEYVLISKDGGSPNREWTLSYYDSGGTKYIRAAVQNLDGSAQTLLDVSYDLGVGVWRRVTSTWDGDTLRAYVDGTAIGSTTSAAVIGSGASEVYIGALPLNPSATAADATLADVQIFARDLTPAEVAADPAESRQGYPGRLRRVEDD